MSVAGAGANTTASHADVIVDFSAWKRIASLSGLPRALVPSSGLFRALGFIPFHKRKPSMKAIPCSAGERRRNLIILSDPRRWPVWPFLPLVRRRPGQEEERGVLYDALRAKGLTGFSATVFLVNVFLLPP